MYFWLDRYFQHNKQKNGNKNNSNMKQKCVTFMVFVLLVLYVGLSETQATVINDSLCMGTSKTIGYTYPNGAWYLWNTGATTAQITVTPAVNTTYIVTVLNSTFVTIAKDTFNIVVKSPPIVWCTGPTTGICAGESAMIIAHGALTYQWSMGMTNDTIIVTPTTTTNYIVVGYASNGCSATANFIVNVQAAPTPYNIVGDSNYCDGQIGVVIGLNGSEIDCHYTLYKNGVGISNVNGTGYAINFGHQLSGTYTVKGFKNNLGCPLLMNGTLHVTTNPLPQSAGTIIGPVTICQNSVATYSTNAILYATSYDWSIPTGATLVSGQGTSTITVNFGGTNSSGDIKVRGHNACGDGPLSSTLVTVNPLPSLTITSSDTNICAGSSVCLTATTNGTTFLWSNGLGTSNTVTVSPTTTTLYSVTVTGSNGCSTTGSITIVVHAKPIVGLSLTEDHFCTDVNSVVISGGSPTGGIYTGTCVFGGNTVYPPVSGAGTYTIIYTYTDGYGCSASATDLLVINPIPAIMFWSIIGTIRTDTPAFTLTPNVSPTGGTFTGPGIVGNLFNPALAGSGMHMITYTYVHPITGCSASQIQYIPVVGALGVAEVSAAVNRINIFPNPTTHELNLKGIDTKELKQICIMSVLGKTLFTTTTLMETMHIDVSFYPSGTYLIHFINTDGISKGKKFIKIP